MKQRIIKLVVDISSKALDNQPDFARKVLEHVLMTRLPDHPEYPMYSEAVKELHGLASHELRRLAMRYADYFSVCLYKYEHDQPLDANEPFPRPSMTNLK